MRFKEFFILREQQGNIYYHVTSSDNTRNILQKGLLLKQGDRSSQLNEVPGIFLFRDIDSAEDAVGNWLGDEFDEDTILDLLEITLPVNFPLENNLDSWEVISRVDIPPSFIRVKQSNI